MQIAQKLANYTQGSADILRKAMGKKIPEEMEKQKDIFIQGALENNVKETTAKRIFCGGLIFQGLRLTLRQQAPESPVSAPKWSNIFSTSFHCGLIDI